MIYLRSPLRSVLLVSLGMLCLEKADAGGRTGIAGLSMARTFVASARGLEAIGTNPANLALGDHNRSVTFTLIPPFGLNFGSDFLDYEIYNDYFTGVDTGGTERASKYLTESDKARILSLFPSGVAETHYDLDVRLFGLSVHSNTFGSIGISVTERLASNFAMSRDYARFVLTGLDSAGSFYDFGGTSFNTWWLREYTLSYARNLSDLSFARNLAAGLSVKLVHGFGYVGTDRYNATFGNEVLFDGSGNFDGYRLLGNFDFRQLLSGIDAFGSDANDFTPFPAPAGTGFGVDLGVSGEILQGIRGALSVTDVGSILWRLNTREITSTGSFSMTNPTSREQQDSLEEVFTGNEQATGEFSTPLATALHVGGSVQLDETPWTPWLGGRLLVAVEYEQGFNNVPGNTTRARFSLGMEYRPVEFLPLRTGVSFGGQDRFNWAFGFGFDWPVFTLDVGTENIAVLITPDSFDQFSFGLGIRWRI